MQHILIAYDTALLAPDALQMKLLDPDEKVRAAVCKLYSQLDYETALHHISEGQLRAVAGRGLDKKVRSTLCLAPDWNLKV